MEKNRTKCLNPWDAEGKRIFDVSGVMQTLFAGERGGGHLRGICYAIEGNTVDRASSKNGRGWCENVSPTLNTQDKHVVCFEPGIVKREGGASRFVNDKSVTLRANMGDNQPAVVYGIDAASSNSWKSSNPHSGVHEMEVCKCLDTMCLNPQCNQGGVLVVSHWSATESDLPTMETDGAKTGKCTH